MRLVDLLCRMGSRGQESGREGPTHMAHKEPLRVRSRWARERRAFGVSTSRGAWRASTTHVGGRLTLHGLCA